jgi:hypothetical protein
MCKCGTSRERVAGAARLAHAPRGGATRQASAPRGAPDERPAAKRLAPSRRRECSRGGRARATGSPREARRPRDVPHIPEVHGILYVLAFSRPSPHAPHGGMSPRPPSATVVARATASRQRLPSPSLRGGDRRRAGDDVGVAKRARCARMDARGVARRAGCASPRFVVAVRRAPAARPQLFQLRSVLTADPPYRRPSVAARHTLVNQA